MRPHVGANLVIVAALGGTVEVAAAAALDTPSVFPEAQPLRLALSGAGRLDEPVTDCNAGTIAGSLVLTQGNLEPALPLPDLAQATLVVTTLDDVADPHDGVLSLREAISKANANATADRITFAPKLTGGTIALASSLPTINQPLIIDGDLNNNHRPNITVTGAGYNTPLSVRGTSAIIDGLTVTGGGCGFYFPDLGSGIQAHNAKLTVVSSIISHNGSYSGGGIFAEGGSLRIIDSSISQNSASVDYGSTGGGVAAFNAAISIVNSTIDHNIAEPNNGEGSESDSYGGGIFARGGSVSIVRSTISNNSAHGSASDGGEADGGGIAASAVTITNSTVTGNEVHGYKLGESKSVARGGGIHAGSLTIIDSTIADNFAASSDMAGQGGGVSADSMTIRNSIITNNRANTGPDIAGTITHSNGHNLFRQAHVRGAAPGDLRAVDPRLGPLQNNGGPTKTMALLPGSPAIDHGLNADAPGHTDQRGFPRISHGHVDIGAFERQQSGALAATLEPPWTEPTPLVTTAPACDPALHWPPTVTWHWAGR